MSDRTDTPSKRYGIQELVQATGVSRRTIHYYVQRELLPRPEGAGRGHYYTEDHLQRVLRIRELQNRGMTLEEIRVALDRGEADAAPAPGPLDIDVVTRIRVAENVEVQVAHGAEPPTPAQLRALAAAAARILKKGETA